MVVETVQDVATDVQVEGIVGSAVEQVRRLDEFWTQRVEADLWHLEVPVEAFRQRTVLLPD